MKTAKPNFCGFPLRFACLACAATGLDPTATAGTEPQPEAPATSNEECLRCHHCPNPAHSAPCLRTCSRPVAPPVPKAPAPEGLPEVVLLDDLEDRYLPVPFDHKGHAEMAAMGRGCVTCHHHTPQGEEHPACKECHQESPESGDIRKPGLKGAYHRQCLNCHREWSAAEQCNACHWPKSTARQGAVKPAAPTRDDVIGRMHPPIPEPDTDTFAPRNGSQAGTKVVFYHKEHIHRFGLACVECHHEDGCTRCHSDAGSRTPRTPTLAEHHQPCAKCHDTAKSDACSECHWAEGSPRPARFDHASTGLVLERYHRKVSCRACHARVPFSKLDRACSACHTEWKPGAFNHDLTGQMLDVVHSGFDCDACHVDRRFDGPPTCDSCHDAESGVSFPARRPGPAPPRTGEPR